MSNRTVCVLGAGFSRAIGVCKIQEKEFPPPLDADFFHVLEKKKLLERLLADKPCLTHMLDWAGIYDKNNGKLIKEDSSLETFWTQVILMWKLNSSISGFPDFRLLPPRKSTVNGVELLPNIDENGWTSVMSKDEKLLYDVVSKPKGNLFNYEGLILYFADYEIKKTISHVYSEINYQCGKESMVERFKEIVADSAIVSLNYDCLVEKIFDKHLLFPYDKIDSCVDKMNWLILKPHGSLGWVVKKRFRKEGTVEVEERIIKRGTETSSFDSDKIGTRDLSSKTPIIIPMSPGKENFVSGIDPARIELWPDDALKQNPEFIDCVVSYAKALEVIRKAERVVFIGCSFPPTDYEFVVLLDLAFKGSAKKECHICFKGGDIPNPDIACNKVTYYKDGLEHFLEDFV